MGSEELAHKVRRWLKESGQALELGTARTLQRAGLPVVESFHYADPTTQEQREGDVLVHAAKDWFQHDLMVAIECKHASAKPWVGVREAVRRAKSASSPGDWFVYEGSDPDDLFGDAVGAGVLPMEPVCGRVVTALS